MKILFIVHPFLGLYKAIENEMRKQGHEVTVFQTFGQIKLDPYARTNHFPIRQKYRQWYNNHVCNMHDKFWREKIESQKEFSEKYDLLFVLGVVFVNKLFIDHLKSINNNIHAVYYAWDTLKWYDYSPMIKYFDRVYSFDLLDCRKNRQLFFLPNYWIEDTTQQNTKKEYKYDFFFVGQNSTGRYLKLKKIASYLREHNYNYYIRLVDTGGFLETFHEKCIYFIMKALFQNDENYWSYVAYHQEDDEYGIKSQKYVGSTEYKEIGNSSRCIIDIPLSLQTGMPPRFIWAVAHGKKILTTSPWALEHKFVSPSQIQVIDTENIEIPSDFLSTPICTSSDLRFCRIDQWVNTVIHLKDVEIR